jgi:FMN phosphatase YigB (HAD superfamily)
MIDTIVFDVGGVLVFHDNEKMLKRLQALMREPPSTRELISQIRSSGIGAGKLTEAELFSTLRQQYAGIGSVQDWHDAWCCHFQPNSMLIDFLKYELSPNVDCFLCSNTNALHWNYITTNYDFGIKEGNIVLSYKVGHEKPHQQMYETVSQIAASKRGDILFVDDNAENVIAAERFGFQAHSFRSHPPSLLRFCAKVGSLRRNKQRRR